MSSLDKDLHSSNYSAFGDQGFDGHRSIPPTPQALGDTVFNSIRDAILVLSHDGIIERVNPATAQMTGYARRELIGQNISILNRNRRRFEKLFIRSSKNNGERFEMFCRRKDGSYLPVSVSTSIFFDNAEKRQKMILVARDITKRKRIESEARAITKIIHGITTTANLEELLTLIHRTIKNIVYAENFFVALFDPDTEMLTMQFFVDKYDPMPPPQKVGRSLSAYVFRQGRSMLFTADDARRLIESGEVEDVGTDSAIWLGVPLKTPSGIIGVLVVQDYERSDTYSERDVELLSSVADQIAIAIERKRTEQALKISQERFELVTRATSDAVWDWNLATDEIWWNDGLTKLFGYTREEFGSHKSAWQKFIHPADSERVWKDLKAHIRSGLTHWASEYRFRRKDGSYAFVIDRGYVVYNDEGRPVRMLGSMMDVTDRKNLEQQLTHQALHDPLTGIANRILFRDRVEHALAKLPRINFGLSVLFLDLDNFKAINDSLGHAAGDRLLILVAERLQDCLRATDTAARLGGDEFAVLIESVQRNEESLVIAERILEVMRQPFHIEGREVFVGVSIGIANCSNEKATADELLRNADLAMYLAKSGGKGRYVIFEPRMHDELMQRIELEEDLRRGIDSKEFILYYQPIFDLDTSRPLGVEALVRWKHPKFGVLPPMRFIPLAEETSLIVPLGDWILTEACRQTAEWKNRLDLADDFSVTVNISIRQFQSNELMGIVNKALKLSGLPPKCLILEITESFLMQDTEATINKLNELRKIGCRLAIDDFGTGYSSLSYLQRFPIDILKIDKSFVDKLGRGGEGNAVARAIITMGDSLRLKTIAEGIEFAEQISELRDLGCAAGQGFHFAKPLDAGSIEGFLSQKK
jgi:diguanylate cyclase (GGDEF)-like protein/PAS domain S-box-containing protein